VDALVPIAEKQSRVKVEAVYCLGMCSVGPSALVGDQVIARLDQARLSSLLEAM
jgi:formate dehydrogenase subunit gamma